MNLIFSFYLALFCIFTQLQAQTPQSCVKNKQIETLAIVGHETTFMMKLLTVAKKKFKQVYFVPMRENLQNGNEFPVLPKGITVFRGPDKFDQLLKENPQGIITFQFEYAEKLKALTTCEQPKMIVLSSKTSVDHYEAMRPDLRKALSMIKIVSFWHSRLKTPDSYHGLGRSILKVFDSLHINKDQSVLLLGYGKTGKGIAHYLQQAGYRVGVYDIDPTEVVLALHDGLAVGSLQSLAKKADVLIDATGDTSNVLTLESANFFEKPKVYVVSSSTHDHGISITNGYQNSHGTIFTIDGSHGMINMHHKIGGSDDEAMRVTGYSLLYMMEDYPAIIKDLAPINHNLYQLSPAFEGKIAESFLKEPQLLGGPPIPQ